MLILKICHTSGKGIANQHYNKLCRLAHLSDSWGTDKRVRPHSFLNSVTIILAWTKRTSVRLLRLIQKNSYTTSRKGKLRIGLPWTNVNGFPISFLHLKMRFDSQKNLASISSKVLVSLALEQGEPLNYQRLARNTRVSVPTLKKIISAMESLFLIRQLPLEGGRKGHVIYLEDQGEHHQLSTGKTSKTAIMEHYLWLQMRAQFIYSYDEDPEFFQYRTRGEAIIPFAVRTQNGVLGFLWSPTAEPSLSLRYTAQSFLKTYSRGKIIIAHPGSTWRKFSDRILIVPAIEF